jgi:hypothetical protein
MPKVKKKSGVDKTGFSVRVQVSGVKKTGTGSEQVRGYELEGF